MNRGDFAPKAGKYSVCIVYQMIVDGELNLLHNINLDLDEFADGEEDGDVIKELYRIWRNERGSAELQDNCEDLVREVLELIEFQSNKLSENSEDPNFAFLDCLYQMDLERTKFVLKSLLRCRMGKIERGWAEFWETWGASNERSEQLQSRLCSFEREYLQSLAGNLISSLQDSVLQKLPPQLATLNDEEMSWSGARPVAAAEADNHVICRVKKDLGEVVLDPITRATAALQADDIFVLQYSVIKSFLQSGEIELI